MQNIGSPLLTPTFRKTRSKESLSVSSRTNGGGGGKRIIGGGSKFPFLGGRVHNLRAFEISPLHLTFSNPPLRFLMTQERLDLVTCIRQWYICPRGVSWLASGHATCVISAGDLAYTTFPIRGIFSHGQATQKDRVATSPVLKGGRQNQRFRKGVGGLEGVGARKVLRCARDSGLFSRGTAFFLCPLGEGGLHFSGGFFGSYSSGI